MLINLYGRFIYPTLVNGIIACFYGWFMPGRIVSEITWLNRISACGSYNSIDDPRKTNITRLGALVIALLVVAPVTDRLLYRGYICMRFAWPFRVSVCIDLNPLFVQARLQFPAMSNEGDKLCRRRITSTLRPSTGVHCKKNFDWNFRQNIRSSFADTVWILRHTLLNF